MPRSRPGVIYFVSLVCFVVTSVRNGPKLIPFLNPSPHEN
jgi:hypothetical protein